MKRLEENLLETSHDTGIGDDLSHKISKVQVDLVMIPGQEPWLLSESPYTQSPSTKGFSGSTGQLARLVLGLDSISQSSSAPSAWVHVGARLRAGGSASRGSGSSRSVQSRGCCSTRARGGLLLYTFHSRQFASATPGRPRCFSFRCCRWVRGHPHAPGTLPAPHAPPCCTCVSWSAPPGSPPIPPASAETREGRGRGCVRVRGRLAAGGWRLAARGPGSGCAAQRAGAPIRAVAAPTAAFQPPGAPRAPCAASLQLSAMHFVLGEPGRREDGGRRQRDSPRPYFHRAPVPLWLGGENALWPGFLVNPAAVPAAERGWWPPARSPGRRADGSASLPPLCTRTTRKSPQCHSPLVVLQLLQLECVSHGSARVLLLCEELPRDSCRPTC
nr:uncharacterized protein LOC103345952 [Oryctolagus cuniculus]